MLQLASKQSEKIDLYSLIKKNVEESNGPQVFAAIDGSVKQLQIFRDELLQLASLRSDSVALEKLSNTAKSYLNLWANISQSFTFGKEKV